MTAWYDLHVECNHAADAYAASQRAPQIRRTPDSRFYAQPRFVTHIADAAVAAVTQLSRERFRPIAPFWI
jgi:hypothetical protein